jgi:hypothetical protein
MPGSQPSSPPLPLRTSVNHDYRGCSAGSRLTCGVDDDPVNYKAVLYFPLDRFNFSQEAFFNVRVCDSQPPSPEWLSCPAGDEDLGGVGGVIGEVCHPAAVPAEGHGRTAPGAQGGFEPVLDFSSPGRNFPDESFSAFMSIKNEGLAVRRPGDVSDGSLVIRTRQESLSSGCRKDRGSRPGKTISIGPKGGDLFAVG